MRLDQGERLDVYQDSRLQAYSRRELPGIATGCWEPCFIVTARRDPCEGCHGYLSVELSSAVQVPAPVWANHLTGNPPLVSHGNNHL
jgi:hypothetical protein